MLSDSVSLHSDSTQMLLLQSMTDVTCSSYSTTLTLLPWRHAPPVFPLLQSGWTWNLQKQCSVVSERGQKMQCSFCRVLLGHSSLEL